MLKKYLIQLFNEKIKKYLGEWDIKKNIRVNSIKTPNVTLTNVPLPSKLFDLIQLPLVLEYSNISSVSCQCSWSTLLGNGGKDFLKIMAEDVEIRLRFLYPSEWNSSTCLNLFCSKKKKKSEQLKQIPSLFSNGYGSTASAQSFESRILNALKLFVKNIHIRIYEDNFSSVPFAFDIYIADFIMNYPSFTDKRISENEIEELKKGSLKVLWIQFIGLHIIYKEFDTHRYFNRKRAWIYENFCKDFKYHLWNKKQSQVKVPSRRNAPYNNSSIKRIPSFYSSRRKSKFFFSIHPTIRRSKVFKKRTRRRKLLPVDYKLSSYTLKQPVKKGFNCFEHATISNKLMFRKRNNMYRLIRRRQVLSFFLKSTRNLLECKVRFNKIVTMIKGVNKHVSFQKSKDKYSSRTFMFDGTWKRNKRGKGGKIYRVKDSERCIKNFASVDERKHFSHEYSKRRTLKKRYSLSLSPENTDDDGYRQDCRDPSLDSIQTYSKKCHARYGRRVQKTESEIVSDCGDVGSELDFEFKEFTLNDTSSCSRRSTEKTIDKPLNLKWNTSQQKKTRRNKVTIDEKKIFNLNRYETPFSTPENTLTCREAAWRKKCSKKGKYGVNDENKYGFRITPYQGIEMHILLKIWNLSNIQRQNLADAILRTISIYFIAHNPEYFEHNEKNTMADNPTETVRKETVWPDADYLNLPLVITFTEAALEAFFNLLKFFQLWEQFVKGVTLPYEKIPTENICKTYIELWNNFINDPELDASGRKQLEIMEKELPLYCISGLRDQAEILKYQASPLSQLNIRLKQHLHNFFNNLFSNRREDKIGVKEFEKNIPNYFCDTKKSASAQTSALNNDLEYSQHFENDHGCTRAESFSKEYNIFKENNYHWFRYEGVSEIVIPHLCLEIIPGVQPGAHTQTSLLSILPKSSKIPIFQKKEYSVKKPPKGSVALMGTGHSFVTCCFFRYVSKKINSHCKEMNIFLDNVRIVNRPVELFLVRASAQLYRKYQHNQLIQVPLPHHLIISQPVTEQEPELVFCCMVDYENLVAQFKKNTNDSLKKNKIEENLRLNSEVASQKNKNKMQDSFTISNSDMHDTNFSYVTLQNMEPEINLKKRFSLIIRENRVKDFKKTLVVMPHCVVNGIPFLHFFQYFPPKYNVNRDLFESIDAPISQKVIDAQNFAAFSSIDTRLVELNISYVYLLLDVQNDIVVKHKAKNVQHESILKQNILFEKNRKGGRRRFKTMSKNQLVARRLVGVVKNFSFVHTQRRPISIKIESVNVYAASCMMKTRYAKQSQFSVTFDMSTRLELFPECTTTSQKFYDEKQKIIIFQTQSLRFPSFEDGDLLFCLHRFHLVKNWLSKKETLHDTLESTTIVKQDDCNRTWEARRRKVSPQGSGLVNNYCRTMDIGVDYVLLSACDTLLLAVCYIEALHLKDIPLKNILLRFKLLTSLRYIDPKTHAIPFVPKYVWKPKIQQGKLKLLDPVVLDFNKSNSYSSEFNSVVFSQEKDSNISSFTSKKRRRTFEKFREKKHDKCALSSQICTISNKKFLIGKMDMFFFLKKEAKLRMELHLLGGSAEKVSRNQCVIKTNFEVEIQEVYADYLFPTTNVKCFSSVFVSANTAHVFGEKNISFDCMKNTNSHRKPIMYYYLKNHESLCTTCGKVNCWDSLHNRNMFFVPDTSHHCSFVLKKLNYCMKKKKCFCKKDNTQTNHYANIGNRRGFTNEDHSDINIFRHKDNSLLTKKELVSHLSNKALSNDVSLDENLQVTPPLSSKVVDVKHLSNITTKILYKNLLSKIFSCPASNILKTTKFVRIKPQVLARITREEASQEIIFNMHSLHMFITPSVVQCINQIFQSYDKNVKLIRRKFMISYKQRKIRKKKIPKIITLELRKFDTQNLANGNEKTFVLRAVDYDGTNTSIHPKINDGRKRNNSSNLTQQSSEYVASLPIREVNVEERKDKHSDWSTIRRKQTEPSKETQSVTVINRTASENQGTRNKDGFAIDKRGQLNEEKLISVSIPHTRGKDITNLLKLQNKIKSVSVDGWPAVRNLRQLLNLRNGLRQLEDGRCACLDFDSTACRITGCLKISFSYTKELDNSKGTINNNDKWVRDTKKTNRTLECTNGGQIDEVIEINFICHKFEITFLQNCTWPLLSLNLRFITAKVVFSLGESKKKKQQKDQSSENINNALTSESPSLKWYTKRQTRRSAMFLKAKNSKQSFEELKTKKPLTLIKQFENVEFCAMRIDDIILWSNSFWRKSNNYKNKLNVRKEYKTFVDEGGDTNESFKCDVPLSYSIVQGSSLFGSPNADENLSYSLYQQQELPKSTLFNISEHTDEEDAKNRTPSNSRYLRGKIFESSTHFKKTEKLSLLPSIPPYPFHKYHSCLLPVVYIDSTENKEKTSGNTSQLCFHYTRKKHTPDSFISLKLPPSIVVLEPYTMKTYTNIISYFKSWVQLMNASYSQRTIFHKSNYCQSNTEKSSSSNTCNIQTNGVQNKKTNVQLKKANLSKSIFSYEMETLLSKLSQLHLNFYLDVEINKCLIRMAGADEVVASLKIPAQSIDMFPDTYTDTKSMCGVSDMLLPHNYYRIINLDTDSVATISFSTCFVIQCVSNDPDSFFTVHHTIPDIVSYQKYLEKYKETRGESFQNSIPSLDSLIAISMENDPLKNSFNSKKLLIGITINIPVFCLNYSMGRRIINQKKNGLGFDIHKNTEDKSETKRKQKPSKYRESYETTKDEEPNVDGLKLTILRMDTEFFILESFEHFYASVCIREILLHDTKKKIVYNTRKLYHYMNQLNLSKSLQQHNICRNRRFLGKSNAGATEENQIVFSFSCNKLRRIVKIQVHSTRIEIHLKTLDMIHDAIMLFSKILRDYQILFIVFPDFLMQELHIASTTKNLRGFSVFCFGCVRKEITDKKSISIFFPSRLPLKLQTFTSTCIPLKGLYNDDYNDAFSPSSYICLISTEEIIFDNPRPVEYLKRISLTNKKTPMSTSRMFLNRKQLRSFHSPPKDNNSNLVSPFLWQVSGSYNVHNLNDKSRCFIKIKKNCSTSIMNNKGMKLLEETNDDNSTKQLINVNRNSPFLIKTNHPHNHARSKTSHALSLCSLSKTKINPSESEFDAKSHVSKPVWFRNRKRPLLTLTKQFDKNETRKNNVKLVETFQNRLSALFPLKSLDISKSKKHHYYLSTEELPCSLDSSFQHTPDHVNGNLTKKMVLISEKWAAQMAMFCLEIWLCPDNCYFETKKKKNTQFTYKNSKLTSSGSILSPIQHNVHVLNTYRDVYSERTKNFTNILLNNWTKVRYSSVIPSNLLQLRKLASVQNNLTNTCWRCSEKYKISHHKCQCFTGCLISFFSELKYKGGNFSGIFKINELNALFGFPRDPFKHILSKSTLFNLDNQAREKETNLNFLCSHFRRRICYKCLNAWCDNLKQEEKSFFQCQNYLREQGQYSNMVHSSRKMTYKKPALRLPIFHRGITIKREDETCFPSVLMDVAGEMLIPGFDNKEKKDYFCTLKYFVFSFEKQNKENSKKDNFVTTALKNFDVNLSMERMLHLKQVSQMFTLMRRKYIENWNKKILFSSDFFTNLLVNQLVKLKVDSLIRQNRLDASEETFLSNGGMRMQSADPKKNFVYTLKHYQEIDLLKGNKSSFFFVPTSRCVESTKKNCDIVSSGSNKVSILARYMNQRFRKNVTSLKNVNLSAKKAVQNGKKIMDLSNNVKKEKFLQQFKIKKFNEDKDSLDRRIIRFFFWLCNPRNSGLVIHFHGRIENVTVNFRASYVKIIKLSIQKSNVEATVPLVKPSFIMCRTHFELSTYNPIARSYNSHHEPLCINLRIDRTETYLCLAKPLPWLDISLQLNPFVLSITSESLQLCRYIYDLFENSDQNNIKCRGSRKMIIYNATHTPMILFQQVNQAGFTVHNRIKRNYNFHHTVLKEFEKGTASNEFPLWFGLKRFNVEKTKRSAKDFQTDNSIDIKIENSSTSSASTNPKKLGIKKQLKKKTTLNLNTNEEIRDFILQILHLGEENLNSQFLQKYYKQLLLSSTENVKNILKFIIDNMSTLVKEYRKHCFLFTIANVIQIFRHKKNWMFLGNLLADYETTRAYSTSNGVYDIVVEPIPASSSTTMWTLCVGTTIQIANFSGFSMKIFKSCRTGNVMRFTERLQKDVGEILSGQSCENRYATKDNVLILEPQSNVFVPISWFSKTTIPFIVPYLSDPRISGLASDSWLNEQNNVCPTFKIQSTNNVNEKSLSNDSDTYQPFNNCQHSNHFETSLSSLRRNSTIDAVLTPQLFSLLQTILEYILTPKYTQKKKLFKQRTTLSFRKNITWEVILETTEIPTNTSDKVACRYQINILPYTTIQNTLPFPISVYLYPFYSKKKKNGNHSTIYVKSSFKNSSETDFHNLLHSRPLTAYILPHCSWLIPLEKRCIFLKVVVHGSPIETFEQRFCMNGLIKNYSYRDNRQLDRMSENTEKNDLDYQILAQHKKSCRLPTYISTVFSLLLPYYDSSTSCIHLQCENESALDRNVFLNQYLSLYTKLNEHTTSFPVTSTYSNFTISADISRQRINFQLPFLVENTCHDLVVIFNSKIIPPGCRLYVSEDQAKFCRINVVRENPKNLDSTGDFYEVSSMSHRIDLLAPTTTPRPPIFLRFDKVKRRYLRIRKKNRQNRLTTRRNINFEENLTPNLSKNNQQEATENKEYGFKDNLKENMLSSNKRKTSDCTQNPQSSYFKVMKILSRLLQPLKNNQEMCNDSTKGLNRAHENGFASNNDVVVSTVIPIGGLDSTASRPLNNYTFSQIKLPNSVTRAAGSPIKNSNVGLSWCRFKKTLQKILQNSVCFMETVFQFYASTLLKFFALLGDNYRKGTNLSTARQMSNTSSKSLYSDGLLCQHSKFINGSRTITDINSTKPLFNQSGNSLQRLPCCSSDLSDTHFDQGSRPMDCDTIMLKQSVCQMKLPHKTIILQNFSNKYSFEKPKTKLLRSNLNTFVKRKKKNFYSMNNFVEELPWFSKSRKQMFLKKIKTKRKQNQVYLQRVSSSSEKCGKTYLKFAEYRNHSQQKKNYLRKSRRHFTKRLSQHSQKPYPDCHSKVENSIVSLGIGVRYATVPYENSKIITISPRYIFYSQLPYSVTIRNIKIKYLFHINNGKNYFTPEAMSLNLHPYQCAPFHTKEYPCYIEMIKDDVIYKSTPFTLSPPRIPFLYQVLLTCQTKNTAPNDCTVQINVVSGMFPSFLRRPPSPYSSNVIFFILSIPDYFEFKIYNCSSYDIQVKNSNSMKAYSEDSKNSLGKKSRFSSSLNHVFRDNVTNVTSNREKHEEKDNNVRETNRPSKNTVVSSIQTRYLVIESQKSIPYFPLIRDDEVKLELSVVGCEKPIWIPFSLSRVTDEPIVIPFNSFKKKNGDLNDCEKTCTTDAKLKLHLKQQHEPHSLLCHQASSKKKNQLYGIVTIAKSGCRMLTVYNSRFSTKKKRATSLLQDDKSRDVLNFNKIIGANSSTKSMLLGSSSCDDVERTTQLPFLIINFEMDFPKLTVTWKKQSEVILALHLTSMNLKSFILTERYAKCLGDIQHLRGVLKDASPHAVKHEKNHFSLQVTESPLVLCNKNLHHFHQHGQTTKEPFQVNTVPSYQNTLDPFHIYKSLKAFMDDMLSKSQASVDFTMEGIHLDHYLKGDVPVILQSVSYDKSSSQHVYTPFAQISLLKRIRNPEFAPSFDAIMIKLSPLVVNLDFAVVEQLWTLAEKTINETFVNKRFSLENPVTRKKDLSLLKESMRAEESLSETSMNYRNPYRKYYLVCIPRYSMKQEYYSVSDTSLGSQSYHNFSNVPIESGHSFENSLQTEMHSHPENIGRLACMFSCRNKLQTEFLENVHIRIINEENLKQVYNNDFDRFLCFVVSHEHIADILNQIYNKCYQTSQGMKTFLNSYCSCTLLENNPMLNFDQNHIINGVYLLSKFTPAEIQTIHEAGFHPINKFNCEMSKHTIQHVKKVFEERVIAIYSSSQFSHYFLFPCPEWRELKQAKSFYIQSLKIHSCSMTISIRTSNKRISRHVLNIIDSLPLDTPYTRVQIGGVTRMCMVCTWRELLNSLHHSYFKQLIRQTLPYAWLFNPLAFALGLSRGTTALISCVSKESKRKRPNRNFSIEGAILGFRLGFVILTLYTAGGFFQTISHFANILYKLLGGSRSKPHGLIDAFWKGTCGLFRDMLITPWILLFRSPVTAFARDDSILMVLLICVVCLFRCFVSPLFGLLNLITTITEGLANVLIGDFEQYTRIHEQYEFQQQFYSKKTRKKNIFEKTNF